MRTEILVPGYTMHDGKIYNGPLMSREYEQSKADADHDNRVEAQRYVALRFVCTKEMPWTEAKGPAIHPDAKDDGDGDDFDRYKCPNCNLEFKVEVPQ